MKSNLSKDFFTETIFSDLSDFLLEIDTVLQMAFDQWVQL